MEEIKSLERRLDDIKLKRKINNIKLCYSNLKDINDIMNSLKEKGNDLLKDHKQKLRKICEIERNTNIEYIIHLSYNSFVENLSSEKDFKNLFIDIKNSSFYEEYKNKNDDQIREKLKEMEIIVKIFDLIEEAEKKKNYRYAFEEFTKLQKKIYDEDLKEVLEENIENCKIGILNNETLEINKLIEQKNYEIATDKIEGLLEEFKNEYILFEDLSRIYLDILEERIEIKKKEGENFEIEIEKFQKFIKKNKDNLDDYDVYKKKLINFKSNENDYKQKEIKIDNFLPLIDKNNYVEKDRQKIEAYLKEIKKLIPQRDLNDFIKCKKYILSQITNFENEEKNNFKDSKKWIKDRKSYKKQINDIKNIGKIYALFNQINKKYTNFDIHTIQLISLLLLSKENPKSIKGVFCKINTGEGKSTIIQFFAAYKVLLGNKVDIISSSAVLAERDALEEKKIAFFKELNITVGVIKERDKHKTYSLDIVYGDTTQFSADILLQEYEFIQTRMDRKFDVVIIDEVDNMCIDNLATKTQLTKKFSGYQSLYTFYYIILYVFNFIAFDMKLTNNRDELEQKRKIIKEVILQKLKGNTVDWKKYEKENEKDVIAEIDEYILKKRKSGDEKNKVESSEESGEEKDNNIEKKIQKLLTEDGKLFEVNGKNTVGILYPNYLKSEIESHIEYWIDSVITSFSMIENIDFRIDKNKEGNYNKIIPIDFSNTGVSQPNMVWNEALHQILQIINDVEVFPENINTNFLLIISYFQRYKELYGLTGTIGSKTNQETLKKLYKVQLFFVPPNLKSKLKKRTELFYKEKKEWQKKIIEEIKEIINKENRSVLLICNSIKMGEEFEKIIKKSGVHNVKKYFTEEDKNVVEETLEQHYIIIATNLAGRGTDIKISENLEKAGGLHVIVSFLPLNQRVEDQNYGRAGRKGQQGSYSLIFKYDSDKSNPLLTVDSIKKKREEFEKSNFEDFCKNEMKNIKLEEEIFNDYCKYRKDVLNQCGDDFIKEDNEYQWGKIFNSKEINIKKKKNVRKFEKTKTKC